MQTQTWLIWSPGFKLLCSNLSKVSGKIPPVSKARLGRAVGLTWSNLSFGKIPLIIHGAHACVCVCVREREREREREGDRAVRRSEEWVTRTWQRSRGAAVAWIGWDGGQGAG